MTEYETASLAMQQSLLDMMRLQIIVSAVVTGVVGLLKAGVVFWGIWYMKREGKKLDEQNMLRHAAVMARFAAERKESEERHAETMKALRTGAGSQPPAPRFPGGSSS